VSTCGERDAHFAKPRFAKPRFDYRHDLRVNWHFQNVRDRKLPGQKFAFCRL